MQLPYLLEEGLEHLVIDRHRRRTLLAGGPGNQRRHVPCRLVAVGRYVSRRGARLARPLAGGWCIARLWSPIFRLLVVFEVAWFRLVFALWVSAVHGVCHVRAGARVQPKRNVCRLISVGG
jgi:hypothetical protein